MINEQLQKIIELDNLYKSGAITAKEFEDLKKEVLGINRTSADVISKSDINILYFKDYQDSDGKLIIAPRIDSLNDRNQLASAKEFLIGKYIHCPNYFTKDELNIFEKYFTSDEIEIISSNRSGFNLPIFSIGGILSGVFAFVLVTISPCLMYFGGGTALAYSAICFFVIISQKKSTKSDKMASWIILIEIIGAIVYFGVVWKEAFH